MQSINTADMAAEAEKHDKELLQMREQLTGMETRIEEIDDYWRQRRSSRMADQLRDQMIGEGVSQAKAEQLTGDLRGWVLSLLENLDVQRRLHSSATDLAQAARTTGSLAHVAERIATLTRHS